MADITSNITEALRTFIDRLIVILKAAPTYLVALALVAGIILDELEQLGPVPAPVVKVLAGIVAIATAAVVIIRRVTPVLEQARGVLPAAVGQPRTELELELKRKLNAHHGAGTE